MAYDPTIPDESNLVTDPVSGDLVKMRENFEAIAPLVSAVVLSGTAPSGAVRGIYLGDDTNRKRYFIEADSDDWLNLQRNTGTEGSPIWESVLSFNQAASGVVVVPWNISGIEPVSGEHLATKTYADSAMTSATLSGLADTAVSGATSGQALIWDGSDWVPVMLALNDLSDVNNTGSVSGQVLFKYGSTYGNIYYRLTHLTDTYLDGQTSGQVLYNSDNQAWIAKDFKLAELTDTDTSGAASGQSLVWNGATWGPDFLALSGLSDTSISGGITSGQALIWDGSSWTSNPDLYVPGSATIGSIVSGDGVVNWLISGQVAFVLGIDRSDSDKLKLATYEGLGLGDILSLTSGGELKAHTELHVPGRFFPRRISQAAAPTSGTDVGQLSSGELAVWEDSDGAAASLIYNDPALGIVSAQLISGVDTSWQTPTFSGDWSDYAGGWQVARYRKKNDGQVYLEGLVTKASGLDANTPSTIFTLPVGYRPVSAHLFHASAPVGLGQAEVRIYSNGNVRAYITTSGSSVNYYTLDGINFDAAA